MRRTTSQKEPEETVDNIYPQPLSILELSETLKYPFNVQRDQK